MSIDWSSVVSLGQQVMATAQHVHKNDTRIRKALGRLPRAIESCREYLEAAREAGIEDHDTAEHLRRELREAERKCRVWREQAEGMGEPARWWNYFFESKMKASELEDIICSLEGYRDDLHRLVELGAAAASPAPSRRSNRARLSSCEGGSFEEYQVVENESARQVWRDNFPGLRQVHWSDFRNWLRDDVEEVSGADEWERQALFFWLRERLQAQDKVKRKGDVEPGVVRVEAFNEWTRGGGSFAEVVRGALGESAALHRAFHAPPSLEESNMKSKKGVPPSAPRLAALRGDAGDRVLKVDVGILMDCTHSMQPWIDATREKLRGIVESLREHFGAQVQGFEDIRIRVGFVGYRDFGDKEHFVVHDFTSDLESVLGVMEGIEASGGRDLPEDVFGGLEMATLLSWVKGQGVVRRLIHVADAPGHGTLYNDLGANDRHAHVDPDGSVGKRLVEKVAWNGIDYAFIKMPCGVTKKMTTDKMLNVFKGIYDEVGGRLPFRAYELETPTEKFSEHMSKLIIDSIHSVVSKPKT